MSADNEQQPDRELRRAAASRGHWIAIANTYGPAVAERLLGRWRSSWPQPSSSSSSESSADDRPEEQLDR